MTSVVFVRLSAMGDLVQSLGAVASLREVRPGVRITFVTQSGWASLIEGVPGVDQVITFDRRGGLAALWRVRAALRRTQHDWALDLQGNWKSALMTRWCKASRCVGMASPWRQEPASRVLLKQVVACGATPHPARAAWELVRQIAPEAPFRRPHLSASESEIERERAALAQAGIDASRPFRVLVVTDPSDPRALSAATLRAARGRADMPALSLLGPAEAHLSSDDPSLAGCRAVLRQDQGGPRRLVALGAIVARAEGAVVGPDQGASHVLLAAGAPGELFFGSQDPARTSPPSARAFVGAAPLSCRPCRARRCQNPLGSICMDETEQGWRAVDVGLPEDVARLRSEGG
ncbi:MAG: glycosyltransferase family 9 protein [Planctomycetota bacterium]